MKTVSTLEEIEKLPCRSIIVGPSWDDELYQKADAIHWLAPGSEDPWLSDQLESRGPFVVLREGEILDDEERPAILPVRDRPFDTFRAMLRVAEFPIGQVEVNSFNGQIQLHYSREDLINQVRTLVRESRE